MKPATLRICAAAARLPLRLARVLAVSGSCLSGLSCAFDAVPPTPAASEAGAAPARPAEPAARAPPGQAAIGPQPYPSGAQPWPGRGVTRVFGWMAENRRAFWQQRAQKQGSVVFAGDSLIAGWRTLQSDFPSWPTANRGIGGDVSRGLLFRFREDVLELHPRGIVLLIGTNDLSARQAPADTLFNIAAMLDMAGLRHAGVPVVLCTLPPRAHREAPVDPVRLAELNAGIRALAAERAGVTVVDLFEPLSADDGSLDERYFSADRLHLSPAGYARWKDLLAPALAALAGAGSATPTRVATGSTP